MIEIDLLKGSLFQIKQQEEELRKVVERRKPIEDKWTPKHTSFFLSYIIPELMSFSSKFESEGVDGEILMKFTTEELKDEFGMNEKQVEILNQAFTTRSNMNPITTTPSPINSTPPQMNSNVEKKPTGSLLVEELEDGELWEADERHALIISMSDYSSDSGQQKLKTTTADGTAIQRFLETSCGFTSARISEIENPDPISEKFDEISSKAAQAKRGKKILFFIYYSGHGAVENNMTIGFTLSGKKFDLESQIRELSLRSNILVIGFLDCCRTFQRKITTSKTAPKQLALLFAVPVGEAANASLSDTLSVATKAFLGQMESNNQTFPTSIRGWARKHAYEMIDTVKYEVSLKLNAVKPAITLPGSLEEWETKHLVSWLKTIPNLQGNYENAIVEAKFTGVHLKLMHSKNKLHQLFKIVADALIIESVLEELL